MQSQQLSKLFRMAVWVLAALVGLSVLAVGLTAVSVPGCASCHSTGTFGQQTASGVHSKVSCVRCHAPADVASRASFAFYEVFGMALHVVPDRGRPQAAVPDGVCLSCHEDVNTHIVSAKGLRILHSKCAKGSVCSDCHSSVAHGTATSWPRSAQMERCLDCHASSGPTCNMCHDTKTQAQRLTTGLWAVTHGSSWKTTHGMGDWKTCSACHPAGFCARCHGIELPHAADFLKTHGATASASRVACNVCHKTSFCDDCHGLAMPHPVGFVPSHPGLVKAGGNTVCLTCHVQSDCTNCHVRHVHPGGAISAPSAASVPGSRSATGGVAR